MNPIELKNIERATIVKPIGIPTNNACSNPNIDINFVGMEFCKSELYCRVII
jgi:hypothetical protein